VARLLRPIPQYDPAVIPDRQDGIAAPSKPAAQRRADRIAAFREELEELEREGVLVLPPEERARVAAHHEELLRALASRFDVDLGERARQLSWGMRIASFLGAVALAASAFFFLYRIWGLLATPVLAPECGQQTSETDLRQDPEASGRGGPRPPAAPAGPRRGASPAHTGDEHDDASASLSRRRRRRPPPRAVAGARGAAQQLTRKPL